MGVMTRDGFAELMLPGLRDVVADKFKQYPDEYSKYVVSKNSDRRYEYGLVIEGFGAAPEKNEGAAVQFDDLTQGYKTTFTNASYARGARVTHEAWTDDLYKVFKTKLGTFLARSMKQRREILCADILNNGFTTPGADGKPLFATDHPYKSGGTYANTLATQADLSAASLQDLITVLETTKDAGDITVQLIAKLLIVPPANRWAASTILRSQKDPDSANNAINPLYDMNIKYMVNHYLTDPDSWFVECDEHGLIYFDREKVKLSADDDFDTGDAKVKITMRCCAGYDDPRGIAGCSGI